MILAVGSIKGGVGKSMLAVNIAVALAQRGHDVLLIDGDEQASAATFAQIRSDLASGARFATVQLHGVAIRQQMRHLGSLSALNRRSGAIVWRWPMPEWAGSWLNGFTASPATDGRTLVVGGLDGTLYAFPIE